MDSFLTTHEPTIRLVVFLGVFLSMALLEIWLPRKTLRASKPWRWSTNLGLLVIDGFVLRLVFPAAAVGIALWAEHNTLGLFHWLPMPGWLAGILAIIILDFTIWGWHVASHFIPFLWRFHMVHHADRDLDVSSGIRFHPGEILLSMLWKAIVIVILGAPVEAVLLFEILLNGFSMFTHANVRLPLGLDRWLRFLIVTPDMHRVHHSVHMVETNSNYGFNLSCWDRWFGTYVPQPRDGHDDMVIGLEDHQDDGPVHILWSLLLPVRHKTRRTELSSNK